MKLNVFKNSILAILLIFAYSCKKGNESTPSNGSATQTLFGLLTNKSVQTDGNLTLVANSLSFSDELVPNLDITGSFADKSKNVVKAEKFNVNGFDVKGEPNLRYYRHFSSSTNPKDYDNVATTLFGTDVNIIVSSEKFGNVSANIYTPLYVKLDLADIKNNEIVKSQGFTLKWNKDVGRLALRGAGDEPKVGAAVIYHAGFSDNQSQNSLPVQNVSAFKTANDSDGQITFTPQELAQLPTNGYVIVYTGRANQQIATSTNGQTLAITSLALASSQLLRMQN